MCCQWLHHWVFAQRLRALVRCWARWFIVRCEAAAPRCAKGMGSRATHVKGVASAETCLVTACPRSRLGLKMLSACGAWGLCFETPHGVCFKAWWLACRLMRAPGLTLCPALCICVCGGLVRLSRYGAALAPATLHARLCCPCLVRYVVPDWGHCGPTFVAATERRLWLLFCLLVSRSVGSEERCARPICFVEYGRLPARGPSKGLS